MSKGLLPLPFSGRLLINWEDKSKTTTLYTADQMREYAITNMNRRAESELQECSEVWAVQTEVFQIMFASEEAANNWLSASGFNTPSTYVQPVKLHVFGSCAAPSANGMTDEEIREVIDEIDFKLMVTADDVFYLIARAIARHLSDKGQK